MFVGPDTLINVRITGSIRVEDYADDDYVGFVFGFQNTWDFAWGGTTSMLHEYYLFDWKKNNQTWSGFTALEGYSLNYVNQTFQRTIAATFPSFWVHTNSANFNVLQTSFSTTSGWVPYTTYDFELLYTPTKAIIKIDSDTIFNETGCFEAGLFGFYNYSQGSAKYMNFNYELYVDYTMEAQDVCFGDTAKFIFIDTSGCQGANAFSNLDTFYWDLGDGTISNDTNPWHIYQSSDTFQVSLYATDINGCTDTMTKDIFIHNTPDADLFAESVCLGDTMHFVDTTLHATGDHSSIWSWDFGDGSGTDTLEYPQYAYTQSGTYTVELVIQTNAGCIDTVNEEVFVYHPPNPTFDIQSACDGENVVGIQTATPGTGAITSYKWDIDTNGTYDYFSGNIAHTYATFGQYAVKFRVDDSLGCRDSLVKIANVNAVPTADFFVPGVCFNDASQLIDSSDIDQGYIVTWNWNYGDGNTHQDNSSNPPNPGPQHTYLTAGLQGVSLEVISDSGCSDVKFKNIPVYYLPTANFIADTACENIGTQFDEASYNQSGSLSSFLWSFGDGDTASGAHPHHIYPSPGEFTVTLTAVSSHGCEDTIHKDIRVYPVPITGFGWANNVCEGEELPFYDQTIIPQVTPGGDQVVAWEWIFNQSTVVNTQHADYQTTNAQSIEVQLTAWSNYGCSAWVANTAHIFPLPVASFDKEPKCVDYASLFKNTSTVSTGIVDEWNWDFGDSNTSNLEHPSHVYTASGEYDVTLAIKSNKGCEHEIVRKVKVPETPKASYSIEPNIGCSPFKVYVENTSTISDGYMEYEWYLDDSLITNELNPYFGVWNDTVVPQEHKIKLIVTSDKGCVAKVVDEQAITVLPQPQAHFVISTEDYDAFEPFVNFRNKSVNSIRWEWDFDDGTTSTDFSPVHEFSTSGDYNVVMIAWNEYNCPDTAHIDLDMEAITTLYYPNAFTPNGDGINDFWFVQGFLENREFEMAIYNRWGELLLEADHISFAWDGILPGTNKYAPNGVYVFHIKYEDNSGTAQEIRGQFELRR